MSESLDLAGVTVTLFGRGEVLDHALRFELGRRGYSTHHVSVPTGLLGSATYTVVRLDTPTGADVIKQLATTHEPRFHVVATCAEPSDASESNRLTELCCACSERHAISLLWHQPLNSTGKGLNSRDSDPAAEVIAVAVVDEVAQRLWEDGPSFVNRAIA